MPRTARHPPSSLTRDGIRRSIPDQIQEIRATRRTRALPYGVSAQFSWMRMLLLKLRGGAGVRRQPARSFAGSPRRRLETVPRVTRIAGPAVLVAVALLVLVLGLAYGGGADARPIGDPGALVRFGLPVAKLLVNLGAAVTIGALVLALFALSPKTGRVRPRPRRRRGRRRALHRRRAAPPASSPSSTSPARSVSFDDQFGAKLGLFFTDVELGQAWLATTLIAAALTVLCFAVRGQIAHVFVGVLARRLPGADGAAGPRGRHRRPRRRRHRARPAPRVRRRLARRPAHDRPPPQARSSPAASSRCIERYSTLALVSFIVVAVSGYVSAELRIGTLDRLLTPYGILVLVKVAALSRSACSAPLQRELAHRPDRARRETSGGYFWWLVVAELGFMGIASGVAAALARTATPVAEQARSRARRPRRSSPASRCRPSSPSRGTSPRGTSTCSGCSSRVRHLLLPRRASSGCAGAATRWPIHRTVLWVARAARALLHHQRRRRTRTRSTCSACTCSCTWCSPCSCPCCSCPARR